MRHASARTFIDGLLEVSSSKSATALPKDAEGSALVKSGDADGKYGSGIVPSQKGGKAPAGGKRKYWRDVKGTVARLSGTYFSKEDDGWYEVYWKGEEGADAREYLMKKSKPSGLPEAKKLKTSRKRPTQPTFARKFFGKTYKPNPTVTETVAMSQDAARHAGNERHDKFQNFLANLTTDELQRYIDQYGYAFEQGGEEYQWQTAALKHFAAHHGLEWPKQDNIPEAAEDSSTTDKESEDSPETEPEAADESFALLPDPGVKVVYEEIESLVPDTVEERMHRLQNDTKCTLVPRAKGRQRAKSRLSMLS